MLYIASDHGGFKLKVYLLRELRKLGARIEDLGPYKLNLNDDYPAFAKKVAKRISARPGIDFGVLICRSGQGVCMAANKIKGVRAALAWNVKSAKASRSDDLANVLCLPADYISRAAALKIVRAWLDTPWPKESRFVRRAKAVG